MRTNGIAFSVLFAGLILAGCSGGAYVHDPIKFNREAADFGRPVKDIRSVTICYSTLTSRAEQVVSLAEAECSKFNKVAIFSHQDQKICPLAAPVAAVYRCKKPFIAKPAQIPTRGAGRP